MLIVVALFAWFAGPAYATATCQGNCPTTTTTTPSNVSADADASALAAANANASNRTDVRTDVDVTSVGVGIGQGGDASSKSYAEGGDASSRSYSEGGSAKSSANQDQAQLQGQLQGQVQSSASKSSSNQSQSADNNGNSQDVTVNNNEAREHKPAANTSATVIGNTTAACRSFIGISGGVVSGGGGIGFPITDNDCKFMTLAQSAFAQGNNTLGWNLYCTAPTIVKEIGHDACVQAGGVEILAKPAK
jgi:hypothetical protein